MAELSKSASKKDGELTKVRSTHMAQLEKLLTKNPITAVLSPQGCGKTLLLKTLEKQEKSFYIDLRRISVSPENFAIELIGSICFSRFGSTTENVTDFHNLETLKELSLKQKSKDIINQVENELQKIKPNQLLLVDLAITFAETLAKEENKNISISLDNFDEVLALNNFNSIKDVTSRFIEGTAQNTNARFIIASSSITQLKNILQGHKKVDILELTQFSDEETKETLQRIANVTDKRLISEVQKLTQGNPTAVIAIAKKLKSTTNNSDDKDLIKLILLSELCNDSSALHRYAQSRYTDSLNRARGASLLKTILKVISDNQPLRLTEIAKRIYRSGPVTKSLLERLMEVDLITKRDNTFVFTDNILKIWCILTFKGFIYEDEPDKATTKSIVKELGGVIDG